MGGLHVVAENFLNPPILFFFLGVLAVFVRSDLEIPQTLSKFFSLYLLISIGYTGGMKLAESGFDAYILKTVLAGVFMSAVVPIYCFFLLRRRVPVADAAAIAATYGSVSAVTFLTTVSFLSGAGISFGGHMVAVMALMESPAIIAGVILARKYGASGTEPIRWGSLGREAVTNASVFLLLGSMLIGGVTAEKGWEAMKPFSYDLFKGMLCLFLLDLGLVAARRFRDLRRAGPILVVFAILAPVVNGLLGVAAARLLGLGAGDAILFAVLCGSASYIAVPAAMRLVVPEANPSLFVAMALGVTFPFNLAIGIPMYRVVVQTWWGV